MNNTLKNKLLFFVSLITSTIVGCSTVLDPANKNLNKEESSARIEKSQSKSLLFATNTPSCEIVPSRCEKKTSMKFEKSKPIDCWHKSKKSNVFILAMGANTDGLKYANDDANKFANAMGELFQVHEDQVCILENVSKSEFIQALERLGDANLVDANDLVIIYFSGHGTKGNDQGEQDEEDCFDEMFVTYHPKLKGNPVRDDDFAKLMQDIDKRTHNILTVIDACFSGGLYKSSNEASSERIKYLNSKESPSSPKKCHPVDGKIDPIKGILLLASKETQNALELDKLCHKTMEKDKDMIGGRFTLFFLKALKAATEKSKQHGTKIDLLTVFENTRKLVIAHAAKCSEQRQEPKITKDGQELKIGNEANEDPEPIQKGEYERFQVINSYIPQ